MKGNLLIVHGGGPTAVINASLYGVITEAKKHWEIETIIGSRYGIEGVLNEEFVDLGKESTSTIELLPYTPSSVIGSCRKKLTESEYEDLLHIFKKYNIRYFFYNGGNGTMCSCKEIVELVAESGYEMKVIGIPKTIDNDLYGTDHCPGYGSAARFAAMTTKDLAREVEAFPLYITILEIMGRNAGWLAAASVLGKRNENSCPQLVYLPERPFNDDDFIEDVKFWNTRTKGLLVVVGEGIHYEDGKMVADLGIVDGSGHRVPGGVAQTLAAMVTDRLGIRARAEKPGFVGRASYTLQSIVDRKEAIAAGRFAVQSAIEGQTGYMVAIKRISNEPYKFELELVPLNKVANKEKTFPLEWINEQGNGIKREFEEYCRPLIGEPLPAYADLVYHQIPKVR